MKYCILKFITSTVLMLIAITGLNATHISGGEITYTCLGGDSFLVNLNLYRFCDGEQIGLNTPISFTSPCGNQNVSVPRDSITEVSQLCPSEILNSQCNNGPLPGMEQHWFSTIVVLPPCAAGPWEIWGGPTCCRNSTGNLNSPYANQGPRLGINAMLNNHAAPCNNSPVFSGQPIPYACEGIEVNYSFGTIETDGDSVVYTMEPAMVETAPNPIPATYQPGMSPTNPFPWPATLNPSTGQLTMIPTASAFQYWVIKVCANEYRGGILIGQVCRDVQFIVEPCQNVTPYMSSGGMTNISGGEVLISPNSIEMCVGNTVSFDIVFEDSLSSSQVSSGIGDSITITSNILTALPGATTTITNGNPATLNVTWTAPADASSYNVFHVDIADNACPIQGVGKYSFVINVISATYAGPDFELCIDDTGFIDVVGGTQFHWTVLLGSPITPGVNFSDTTGTNASNVWIKPSQNMLYQIESDLISRCKNLDTIAVTLFSRYDVDFFLDTPFCLTDIPDTAIPVTIEPPGIWSGPGIVNTQIGVFDPVESGSGFIPVNYEITSDQGNCKTDTMIMIEVIPEMVLEINHVTAQPAGAITASVVSGGRPPFNFEWNTGVNGETVISDEPEPFTYILTVTDDNGCIAETSINPVYAQNVIRRGKVKVYPNPNKGLFQVEFSDIKGLVDIRLRNVVGEVVLRKRVNVSGGNVVMFNLDNVSSGLYFIDLIDSMGGRIIEKIKIN